jgi:predicted permease
VDKLLQDLAYALRTMRRDKAFTAAALVTLALGIGATAAVFSIAYNVLWRPLPCPDPDRLVRMYEEHPGAPRPPGEPELSNTTMYPWRERTTALEGMAAYYAHEFTVAVDGEAARVHGADVSAAAFGLLRAKPALGRFFTPADEVPRPTRVVVLSDRYWRERWSASTDAIGRSFLIDGEPYQIVAVAEPGFTFPDRDTRMWVPWNDPTLTDPSVQEGMWLGPTFGRLKPGASIGLAVAEGTAVARSVKRPSAANLLFGTGVPVEVRVDTFARQMTSGVRPVFLILAVGAALALLVASANVAALFLARGVARQRELTVRAAIGATSARLARQLLTESLVLSVAGGALGVLLAAAVVRAMPALAPQSIPRLDSIHLDLSVVASAALASLVAALVAGAAPAISTARSDLFQRGTVPRSQAGDALLVAQCSLAALLLVGAALLGRSFMRLIAVDPGYNSENVLIARVYPHGGATDARNRRLVDDLLAKIRTDRRVVSAGAGNMMPFSDSTYITGFALPPSLGNGKPAKARAILYVVTSGYAEALGLRLREGRLLTDADAGSGAARVLVSREFVRQYLPAGTAAGRSFAGGPFAAAATEIVGVVDDVLKDGKDQRPQPEIYAIDRPGRPIRDEIAVVVRTASSPANVVPLVRDAVRSIDPEAAVGEAGPLSARVDSSLAQPRFAMVSGWLVAMLATLLASAGLYSILSYAVVQRRRELGVRAALGAGRSNLLGIVMKRGLLFTAWGVVLGVGLASASSRLLSSVLFEVSPLDLPSYGVAAVVLLTVASAACLFPAVRASAADPAVLLRD